MGQHIFDSVSSTLTPTRSNFVASSACSVNMVSVQRNVLPRMSWSLLALCSGWRGAGGQSSCLCSHLEILLPTAVALCHSDHTCLRLSTPQQLNTPYPLNTDLHECASMNLKLSKFVCFSANQNMSCN